MESGERKAELEVQMRSLRRKKGEEEKGDREEDAAKEMNYMGT